jgi:SHAQKYF class myb-like DNA-binding protein
MSREEVCAEVYGEHLAHAGDRWPSGAPNGSTWRQAGRPERPEHEWITSQTAAQRSMTTNTSSSGQGSQTWSEDEHRAFLQGVQQLGRGRWREIAKHFVPSRLPSQIAVRSTLPLPRCPSLMLDRLLALTLLDTRPAPEPRAKAFQAPAADPFQSEALLSLRYREAR